MPRLSPFEARAILRACGATLDQDSHALPSDTVDSLVAPADLRRYRKPDSANGSRGRYFHALLIRTASRDA